MQDLSQAAVGRVKPDKTRNAQPVYILQYKPRTFSESYLSNNGGMMKQLLNMLENPTKTWVTMCKSQRDEAEALVKKGWIIKNPHEGSDGDSYRLALSNQERGLVLDILRAGPQVVTAQAYQASVSHLISLGIIEPSVMTNDAFELTYDAIELLNAVEPAPKPSPEASSTEAILAERQTTYGDFTTQAELSQALKGLVQDAYNARPDDDRRLEDYQCEALEMILHKIARIINGDPNYIDNWADCAGYAQLVVKELEKTEGAVNAKVVRQKVINGVLTDI